MSNMYTHKKRCWSTQILRNILVCYFLLYPACAFPEIYQKQFRSSLDSDEGNIFDLLHRQNGNSASNTKKVLPLDSENEKTEQSETEKVQTIKENVKVDDHPNIISAGMTDKKPTYVKRKINATVSQMKLLENMLFNFLSSACPKLNESYPYLLPSSRHIIQGKIRGSAHLLPKKSDKSEKLYHFMQSILQCSSTMNSKHLSEIQARLDGTQNILVIPPKKSSKLFYQNIRNQMDQEAKKLRIESQRDVVPSDDNLVSLITVIQNILEQKCKKIHKNWKSEIQRLLGSLKYLIPKTQIFPGYKRPTLHQSEMFQMIHDVRKCSNELMKI